MGDGVISGHDRNAQLNVVEVLRHVRKPAVNQLQHSVELIVSVMLRKPWHATLSLAQVRVASDVQV